MSLVASLWLALDSVFLGQPSSLPADNLLSTFQCAVATAPDAHFGGFKPCKKSVAVILVDYQVGVCVHSTVFA